MRKKKVFAGKQGLFFVSVFVVLGFLIFVQASNIAGIFLKIEGIMKVNILSPLNTTYNFTKGSLLWLDLEANAESNVAEWYYTLEDIRHGTVVAQNIPFSPNISFEAVRWNNKLTVTANSTDGTLGSDSVEFFVSVPNSAPVIEDSGDRMVCEGQAAYISVYTDDIDEDTLTADLSPKNPFFLLFPPSKLNYTHSYTVIFSGKLAKSDVRNYSELVSVSDGQYSDSKRINISVIEINNAPSVENIGVQTIYAKGENSTFYKEVGINDLEDGTQSSGNFSFNLSFGLEPVLFNISRYGVINFTSNSSTIGVHNITLCVTDNGLRNIHPNISLCGQDGKNISVCQTFSLTVTNNNRPPTIIDYYYPNLSLFANGTDLLYFNVTKFDPDGTIPDSYWYADGILKSYHSTEDPKSWVDNFTYSFGCGVFGNHNVSVRITDGLASDSINWNINLTNVVCPAAPPSGGGGGGGGGGAINVCVVKWGCVDWGVCEKSRKSLEIGLLSKEDFRAIKDACAVFRLADESCGYQLRNCQDVNACNITTTQPEEIQSCIYTPAPSCSDGIKNCHDGRCEFLVDCDGPCSACPTCSDKIQNHGEEGVDCGGPCPWKCKSESPLSSEKQDYLTPVLIIIAIGLVVTLVVVFVIVRNLKREFESIKEKK